jgi:hypothetical protein
VLTLCSACGAGSSIPPASTINQQVRRVLRLSCRVEPCQTVSSKATGGHTGRADRESCLDSQAFLTILTHRGNKHGLHCRQHPRQIPGSMPAPPLPSHRPGLRSARRASESPVRGPGSQRAQTSRLRPLHPGTGRQEGRGPARPATCRALGCLHASRLLLVPAGFERLTRREAAETATARPAHRSARVRRCALPSAIACATL